MAMASLAHLSHEERIGLLSAGVAHILLVYLLVLQVRDAPTPLPIPERMTVSLADEVSLESTAPNPADEAQAAVAPVLSDTPAPVVERRQLQRDRVIPRPTPAPTSRTGGSRMGADFLQGVGSSEGNRGAPAEVAGPAVQASLAQAINRQLKPNWRPPEGIDADKLVTRVRFRLNRDGSLAGSPEIVGQTTGQTPSNQAQVARHRELALRAVRLTAPFELSEQYYDAWKTITVNFNFELSR
jgi:hypothetical protein